MNREQFAKRIRWSKIIWLVGLVNVVAMLPQLWQIVSTQQSRDVSLPMIVLYLLVQIFFSLQGFFTRDRMLMICLGLSAGVSLATIVAALIYR